VKCKKGEQLLKSLIEDGRVTASQALETVLGSFIAYFCNVKRCSDGRNPTSKSYI